MVSSGSSGVLVVVADPGLEGAALVAALRQAAAAMAAAGLPLVLRTRASFCRDG
jgi:hypothetical protein